MNRGNKDSVTNELKRLHDLDVSSIEDSPIDKTVVTIVIGHPVFLYKERHHYSSPEFGLIKIDEHALIFNLHTRTTFNEGRNYVIKKEHNLFHWEYFKLAVRSALAGFVGRAPILVLPDDPVPPEAPQMINADSDDIWRPCLGYGKGKCPHRELDEFNTPCCGIDKVIHPDYYGCVPSLNVNKKVS